MAFIDGKMMKGWQIIYDVNGAISLSVRTTAAHRKSSPTNKLDADSATLLSFLTNACGYFALKAAPASSRPEHAAMTLSTFTNVASAVEFTRHYQKRANAHALENVATYCEEQKAAGAARVAVGQFRDAANGSVVESVSFDRPSEELKRGQATTSSLSALTLFLKLVFAESRALSDIILTTVALIWWNGCARVVTAKKENKGPRLRLLRLKKHTSKIFRQAVPWP